MVSTIADTLRRFRFAEPFRPFELSLQDGRRLRVSEPEHVGWHAGSDALSFAADDDSFEHLRLSDVISVLPANGAEHGA